MKRRSFISSIAGASAVAALSLPASAQVLTLHGASQFGDDHPFTNTTASPLISCCTKTVNWVWKKIISRT
jgi:hypothetical protein